MTSFDVRTAFLYGNLEEEIHIDVPEGVTANAEYSIDNKGASISDYTRENAKIKVVCRLQKFLYKLGWSKLHTTGIKDSVIFFVNLIL